MNPPPQNPPVPAGPAPAPAPAPSRNRNLKKVAKSIKKTLKLLHKLHLSISSPGSATDVPLLNRVNEVVAELEAMQKLADKCDIQVPAEVVKLIDDGMNPDEFMRSVIDGCIAKNQITKGKIDALKSLRKHHMEELEQSFPDEVDAYREIRRASYPESKSLDVAQKVLLET